MKSKQRKLIKGLALSIAIATAFSISPTITAANSTYQQQQDVNTSLPEPMSLSEAQQYAAKYSNEVFYKEYKVKDKFGNKNRDRVFDLLRRGGVNHTGNSIVGVANRTALRLTMQYGVVNSNTKPYVVIGWSGDLAGNPNQGYKPTYMKFVFSSGAEKQIPLQGWEYQAQRITGIFVSSWAHHFWGTITLDDLDVYDIMRNGDIAAVFIDDGAAGIQHFFYSGDKDKANKVALTRGFIHACRMLNLDAATADGLLKARQDAAEAKRKKELRAEIVKEIQSDKEREQLKQEILAEMKAKELASSK